MMPWLEFWSKASVPWISFSKNLFDFSFFPMYECFAHTYRCALRAHLTPEEVRREHQISWTEVRGACEQPYGCWEANVCPLNPWASSPCLWLYFSTARFVNRTKCISHVIKLSHLKREALTCLGEASYPFHNPFKDPSLRNNKCMVFCSPTIHAGSSGLGFYHEILSITSLLLEPNSKMWILLSSSDVSYKQQVCMRGLGRKTSVHSSIKHIHIRKLKVPMTNSRREHHAILHFGQQVSLWSVWHQPSRGPVKEEPTITLQPFEPQTWRLMGGWGVKIGGFWDQSTTTVVFLRNCTFQYKMRISAEVVVFLKFNSKIFVWGQMSSYICASAGRG